MPVCVIVLVVNRKPSCIPAWEIQVASLQSAWMSPHSATLALRCFVAIFSLFGFIVYNFYGQNNTHGVPSLTLLCNHKGNDDKTCSRKKKEIKDKDRTGTVLLASLGSSWQFSLLYSFWANSCTLLLFTEMSITKECHWIGSCWPRCRSLRLLPQFRRWFREVRCRGGDRSSLLRLQVWNVIHTGYFGQEHKCSRSFAKIWFRFLATSGQRYSALYFIWILHNLGHS